MIAKGCGHNPTINHTGRTEMDLDTAEKVIAFLESHKMSLDWWNYLLIALFSIAGGYIGAYLSKKGELKAINEEYENILVQIKEQTKETENIKNNFEQKFSIFTTEREWLRMVVAELLGPLYIQFERTKRASERWDRKNLYLEAHVIKEGNTVIRDLLLTKGHLIPKELLLHAGELIDHYDGWLEKFEEVKRQRDEGKDVTFVFTYDFPRSAETAFKSTFLELRARLYHEE